MKHNSIITLALSATMTLFGLTSLSAPALAQAGGVSYDEMLIDNGGDLDPNHWASATIQELVDKYGIVSGYPDKKFRGDRTLSRFEMAAALYQVLKYIDRGCRYTGLPGGPNGPALSKSELNKLAALQAEFRNELEQVTRAQLDQMTRVDRLERVKIHGKVEARYRERAAVTDGTDTTSPFFAPGNSSTTQVVNAQGEVAARDTSPAFSNNRGQYVRDANGQPTTFNSPMEANVTPDDLALFRLQSRFGLEAMLLDDLHFRTEFDVFELGNLMNGAPLTNGGHNLEEGSASGNPFVLREASLQFGSLVPANHDDLGTPTDLGYGVNVRLGLLSFAQDFNPHTRLSNLFSGQSWVGHGYGLVGWGGSDRAMSHAGESNYVNSLSRYWSGGLNASQVDPDSLGHNRVTAPAAAITGAWGWGKVFLGANYGAVNTNRQMAALGNLGSGTTPVSGSDTAFANPDGTRGLWSGAALQGLDRKGSLVGGTLALPSQYGDGYGVAGIDLAYDGAGLPIRFGLHAMSYLNDAFLGAGQSRKEISGVLDLGWNKNFGLTLSVDKSFIGYDRHSLGVLFNDLGGSGFDIQLGANLATRGLFNLGDLATGNLGLALGIPFIDKGPGKDHLKLIIAMRQSLGDNFGLASQVGAPNRAFKDAGLTVTLPYRNVAGTPLNLTAEYSMLMADALWASRLVAHDISLISSYSF